MSLPSELLTLLGSSLTGSTLRLIGCLIECRRQERLMTLQALSTQSSRGFHYHPKENKSFQWTRRIIALMAIFFVIAFPKLLCVFKPDIAVHIGYTQFSPGFLFFGEVERIKWVSLSGLVITPLDTHLLSAIVGLYFGGSLVCFK